MPIEDVLNQQRDALMHTSGVVGVGIGQRQHGPVIVVMVNDHPSDVMNALPAKLDGYPVEVEEVGGIVAY